MYQGIIFGAVALIAVVILLVFRKVEDDKFDKFIKGLTLAFCLIGFIRFFLSDSFVYAMNGAWRGDVYYDDPDFLQAVLRWGYFTAYSVYPLAIFFNSRFFRNIASYISMPFAILSAVFFDGYMVYFLSEDGGAIHGPEWLRYTYFVIELVVAILIPLLMQIKYKHYFNFKSKREVVNFVVGLPFVLLATMPVYIPQSFVGYGENPHSMFDGYHFAWMIALLVVTLALFFIFRPRPRRERHMLCIFLTLVLFYHFNSIFLMGITLSRLPLQLCNVASYFILIAIVLDLRKMFHFCFLVNVAGTILAIAVASLSDGDWGFWNMHYIFEHSYVLIVPSLAMGFDLYPRVDKKSTKYAFTGFTIYFLFVFVVGILLNGFSDEIGETVNYFYMFDTEVAFDYFPFMSFAGEWYLEFGRFGFYPMVVAIVYAGFSASWILFYWFVRLIYKLSDKWDNRYLSRRLWKDVSKMPQKKEAISEVNLEEMEGQVQG